MLPAPQMHPGTVPGSQTFTTSSTCSGCENGDDRDRRSFPIRSSQCGQPTALPTIHPTSLLQEHNLRRKTPSGTVEAGYDGSPTQPSPGPPPLKHMILPASSSSGLHPLSAHASGHLQQGWNQPSIFGPQKDVLQTDTNPQPSGWEYNDKTLPNTIVASNSSNCRPRAANLGNVQAMTQFPDFYQPVIRSNEHNVRAFCPPPAPTSGSLLFGHMGWQAGSSPWDQRMQDQIPHFGVGYVRPDISAATNSTITDPLIQNSFSRHHGRLTNSNFSSPNTTWNSHSYEHNNRMTSVLMPGSESHPHFQEKALLHAHQSYIDLLSFLQETGKVNRSRTSSGPSIPRKLPACPRPPKLKGLGIFKGAHMTASNTFPSSIEGGSSNRFRRFTLDSGSALQRAMLHRNIMYGDSKSYFSHHQSTERPLPISNASDSIEMLSNLCEQSKWQWIEGMLVGGCLQYGLERYDEALNWFSKIITLNPSHVEAITHMGAALYCLGRHHEAEKSWLMAVNLQPSYLDSTEHLVGHLYRNRSREAIEIVSFVQTALCVVSQATDTAEVGTQSSIFRDGKSLPSSNAKVGPKVLNGLSTFDAAGFGSSGYMLPGVDNGRMLALIHAKGTMLYSQRDIQRAAEAFQEAVLISVGRRVTGVQELVRHIQAALALTGNQQSAEESMVHLLRPLMLPPEKARYTAQLVFGGSGELPGLLFLRNGYSKRAAVQTTSNSLLSLAKILQDAMSTGGVDTNIFRGSFQVGDILALYYLSLSLQESPSTANNVGILLAGVQQVIAAGPDIPISRSQQAKIPGITPGSGLSLALAYYNYGLRLDSNHVHLHTNLGSLFKDVGQLDLAIQMYERAVSCDGKFDIALTNLANAVKDKGRIQDAIVYYQRAVNANPGFAEAVCGLFTALNSVCHWHGRGGAMLDSGGYDRWHVDERGILVDARISGNSTGLTKKVVDIVGLQLKDASHWGRGLLQESLIFRLTKELQPLCKDPSFRIDKALRQWVGQPWEGSRVLRLIERTTKVILRKWYQDLYSSEGKVTSSYTRPRLPQQFAVPSAPTVLPFHTFTCPLTASHIRAIAQRNALRISCSTLRSPWVSSAVHHPPTPPNPHLNVGYVSSDFNNHPLAHLMQSAFGFHNPDRVRAICYATTQSDGSAHRQQIETEAPVFRDVSTWPPERLVEQITQDEIHILVNLNGYTRGARNEIFAARPAPIQMSFMGFAGTLGAEWCDYILADKTAIPATTLRPWRNNVSIEDIFCDNNETEDGDWMYSENVIFCRDTFFCCDHAQSCTAGEKDIAWVDVERQRWEMRKQLFPGMEDDVVILGNFNQLYKIDPTTFRSWLRVLARVPRAVLWLLRFPEAGERNLRATASAWAGPEVANRIIFTDVAPKSQHISRARVCDLFLDTPECNAHTTAADVLWSSTPLLTLPRYPYKMCSRMAASILRGALPRSSEGRQAAMDLITDTEEEYEQRAVDLANGLTFCLTKVGYGQGKGRLADIRKLLWESKVHCGLFNTRRWVADLESAYEEAWRRWVRGIGGDIYL